MRAAAFLFVAFAAPSPGQTQLSDFKDQYLLDLWKPDYTHEPNLGDRKVSFVVGGTTRVEVGPQANFDRYYEVLKLVNSKERRVRLAAVLDLKEYRTIRAARAITSVLGDPDYEVREAAAWALGELGYRSAIRPLIDALEYTYGDRAQLAQSLRKLTGKNFGTSYRRWWAWYESVRKDS